MGEEKRQASDRPQRGRGRPAGCRGGFEGGARGCLTLLSEKPITRGEAGLGQATERPRPTTMHLRTCLWKRRGRLRTGHREAAAGLPAAEEGLRAGPVGV